MAKKKQNESQELMRAAVLDAQQSIVNGSVTHIPCWVPPAISAGEPQVVSDLRPGKEVDIVSNVKRIQKDADPVGFLMAVMMGIPTPVYKIKNNEVTSELKTLSLTGRIAVAKFLADRCVPRMSMKFSNEGGKEPEKFKDLINMAADRGEED